MPATRPHLIEQARKSIRELLELQRRGASGVEVARAAGFAEGFMRGLSEAHLCTSRELLELVRTERQRLDGPATRAEARSFSASLGYEELSPLAG